MQFISKKEKQAGYLKSCNEIKLTSCNKSNRLLNGFENSGLLILKRKKDKQ